MDAVVGEKKGKREKGGWEAVVIIRILYLCTLTYTKCKIGPKDFHAHQSSWSYPVVVASACIRISGTPGDQLCESERAWVAIENSIADEHRFIYK